MTGGVGTTTNHPVTIVQGFIFVFLLLFNGLAANAQLDTLIYDTFTDNRNGWDIFQRESGSLQIRNGYYRVSKVSGPGLVVTIHRFVDVAKDFTIQADFSRGQFSDDKGIGLVWGHSSESFKDNYFLIYPDNSLLVQTDQHGRNDVGKRIAIKNPGAGKITLRVSQQDKKLKFYCNDKLVHTANALPFFGMEAGIITFQSGVFTVDNFLILADTHVHTAEIHDVRKENLGPAVNTQYAEIHPIISADSKTLYYARKNSPENIGGSSDKQDIWYSTSTDGIHWSKGKNLGRGINTSRADNLTAVTSDNNMMFYFPRENGKGGFRLRRREAQGWSHQVLDMEFENESKFVESCLSQDGNIILFTAKTKNNVVYQSEIDERDIYCSFKGSNNKWSKPFNVGLKVNSAGDEFSPFLAADKRTLYFGTNGRPGYGRVDIFMTRRLDDSWKNWSTPINLGPKINTPLFDAYYTVPASGEYAYMVSFQENGDTDLIRIKLPQNIRPDAVLFLRTSTKDATTHRPVGSTIIVKTIKNELIEEVKDDDGKIDIVLSEKKQYIIEAVAHGYLPEADTLSLAGNEYLEKDLVFELKPLRTGDVIKLKTIFFEQAKADLTNESYQELDELVSLMKTNPGLSIRVNGHTDNVGIASQLKELSKARAMAVKKYLIRKGIQSGRIDEKGFGSTAPLVKNDSEENRSKNRRVEIEITRT